MVLERIVVVAPFACKHSTRMSNKVSPAEYVLRRMLPTAALRLNVTCQGGAPRVPGPSKLAKPAVLWTIMLLMGPLECIGVLEAIVRATSFPQFRLYVL